MASGTTSFKLKMVMERTLNVCARREIDLNTGEVYILAKCLIPVIFGNIIGPSRFARNFPFPCLPELVKVFVSPGTTFRDVPTVEYFQAVMNERLLLNLPLFKAPWRPHLHIPRVGTLCRS